MSQKFDLGGSIERQIVNADLAEERSKCNFDQDELRIFLLGEKRIKQEEHLVGLLQRHPELRSTLDYYNMTREEQIKEWWARYRKIIESEELRHLFTESQDPKESLAFW